MITLDGTVVTVALPTIQRDLHFSQASLSWVLDAYLMTFGGFLMLAGRLGDLLGRKRLFLGGLVGFVITSLLCGLARSEGVLVGARFAQGVAAAVDSAMVLGVIATIFPDTVRRAKAMGIYALITSGGSALGLVLGGVITQTFGWHWIFLINLPIGSAALLAGFLVLEDDPGLGLGGGVDVTGAVLITGAATAAVYGLVEASSDGWGSIHSTGPLLAAAALLVGFVILEGRLAHPLIPLGIFRHSNIGPANLVRLLAGVGLFGINFVGVLYAQRVLGYSARLTGVAFLPFVILISIVALSLTPRAVDRLGAWPTLVIALMMLGAGHLLFARAPVHGGYVADVLPPLLLLGAAAGLLFLPSITFAMGDAGPDHAGLASGLANTALQIGAALGVALLASVSAARTRELTAHGQPLAAALTGGYHLAFDLAAGACGAALLASILLRRDRRLVAADGIAPAVPESLPGVGGATPAAADPPGADREGLDQYRFVVPVPLEDRHFHSGHLNFLSAPELLYAIGDRYFNEAIGWDGDRGNGTEHWLSLRNMMINYDSEAFPGESLQCGVRLIRRSRRTLTLRQAMWETTTHRVVVEAEMTRVFFLVASRQAVDVPEDMWAAIRAYEGI